MALRGDVLGPGDGQRRDVLEGEAALVRLGRVGLVELLAADLRRRGLVHPHLGVEPPGRLRRALHHQVAADLVEVVAQAVGEPLRGGVQQQPRRLDRVAGHRDRRRPLEPGDPGPDVVHPGGPAGPLVEPDPGHHRVGPDFGAVRQGIGNVSDQRGRLGVDLAALQAEPAVDAVRAIPEPSVGDGDRPHLGGDPGRACPAQEDLAVAADRVRALRVGVRVAPGPLLARDRQFLLDRFVVGPQVGVARPASPPRRRRWSRWRNRWGETGACSRRSGPSTRRLRGRSCSSPSGPGRRR